MKELFSTRSESRRIQESNKSNQSSKLAPVTRESAAPTLYWPKSQQPLNPAAPLHFPIWAPMGRETKSPGSTGLKSGAPQDLQQTVRILRCPLEERTTQRLYF